MPYLDPYSGELPLDKRIDRLERKIDRLFALLFAYLKGAIGRPADAEGDLQRLLSEALGDRPGDEKEQENDRQRSPGVRVFHVDVDDGGKFRFQPQEQWKYPVGSRVQWVSKTGSFTVQVDPHYTSDYGSPFEGRQEIHSQKDAETGTWKTDVLEVRSLFTPTERMARRLAGAAPVYHTFTIAVSNGDKVYINRDRNGGQC